MVQFKFQKFITDATQMTAKRQDKGAIRAVDIFRGPSYLSQSLASTTH